jgi:dTMP kinase
MKNGLFLTFEGGEGAGKTTLIEAIASQLSAEGHSVLKTREPGGTKMGEQIRHLLLDNTKDVPLCPRAELCLFLAARAQHIQEVIAPALEQQKIVLCDRFNDSTIAYQGVARGLGMQEVTQFCDFISQGLQPNLTLYLDISPEVGLSRAKKVRAQDRIESEAGDFHTKIRQAFLAIHRAHPHRFQLLDASQSPQEVFEEAMRVVRLMMNHV